MPEARHRPVGLVRAAAYLALAGTAGLASARPALVERTRFLMGTTCRISAHVEDPADVESALEAVARVEDDLSTWRPDTPLSRFNAAAGAGPGVEVSPTLLRFLVDCRDWARRTRGAFDPVVGALVDAWDLRGAGRVPDPATLRRARAASGVRLLEIDESAGRARVTRAGAWLDSGGIAKGLALDLAAADLRARGVVDALLDFGGQVLVLGAPADAAAWSIGIADPRDRDSPAVVLDLASGSAATSAQSERGITVAGRLLGHVLDPRNGLPVEFAGSATALAGSGQDADALSTALLVMGPNAGLAWIRTHPGFEAGYLIPRPDGALELRASPGFLALVRGRSDGIVVGRTRSRR